MDRRCDGIRISQQDDPLLTWEVSVHLSGAGDGIECAREARRGKQILPNENYVARMGTSRAPDLGEHARFGERFDDSDDYASLAGRSKRPPNAQPLFVRTSITNGIQYRE